MFPLSDLTRWLSAIGGVACATLVNFWIQRVTGTSIPFLPFFPAVMAVGFLAGVGPGVLALITSALTVGTLWLSPVGAIWRIEDPRHLYALLFYLAAGSAALGIALFARRQLTEARDIRRRLEIALDAGRMVTWEWDLRSGKKTFSGSARTVFGHSWVESNDPFDLVHPEDRDDIRNIVRASLAERTSYQFIKRIVLPDSGETRWLETHGHVQRDDDGRAFRVTGVTLDITERQKAAQQAQESERKFQVALDAGNITVWACDAERRYTWVYNAQMGFKSNQMIGRHIGDLTTRDNCPEYYDAIDRALATGKPERLPVTVSIAGQVRHYFAAIDAVKDPSGNVIGLVGASTDVTPTRTAELALQQSEQRERRRAAELEAVLSAVPAAVFISRDRECRRIFGSRLALELLRRPGDSEVLIGDPNAPPVAGMAVLDASGRELTAAELPLSRAAASGTPQHNARVQFVFADGAHKHLFGNAVPLLADSGLPIGAVSAFVDVSALVAIESQLKDEARRKDEFLAVLAHELRNPMAPIRYAAAMLRQSNTEKQVLRAGEVIERQSAHMARLLDDLLDVARITRGVIELRCEVLDLRRIVAEAIEHARPGVQERQHELEVTETPEAVAVHGDGSRLLQVVSNLIDNARKYTPPGGHIVVSLARDSVHATLKVSDNGIGLEPDSAARVFEMFARLHADRGAAAAGGLGIGLTVAKRLVELHGGSLSVESPGFNRGTTFTIRLPLAVAHDESAGPDEGSKVVSLFADKPQVLVVDDNRDAADSLATLLRSEGFPVKVAYDGITALRLFEQVRPTLVLLDLGLPDIPGHDVALRMRQMTHGQSLQVFAISGWGQEADRRRSRDVGTDEHLVKPVEPDTLLALMATRLHGGQSRASGH